MILDSVHVWHVAKTGDDANGGHAQQYPIALAADAKLTISAAVTAAAAGDTIVIWPGDYAEKVSLTAKPLTLKGISRNGSKIAPANDNGIDAGSNCVIKNLSVEALGADKYGITGGNAARTNIVIEDCDIYGDADGLYFPTIGGQKTDIFISNCRIRGEYDAANFGGVERLICKDTVFYSTGTHASSTMYRAIAQCDNGVFDNCHFYVIPRNAAGVQAQGLLHQSACYVTYNNCVIYVSAGASVDGNLFGVQVQHADANVVLNNCVIRTLAAGTPALHSDLKSISGRLVVNNCSYDTSDGTIAHGGSGHMDAVNAEVDTALSDIGLDTNAVKRIGNAARIG